MKPTAIGAHIYAGGHTLGVRAAGFDAPVHLEEWPFGVETSIKNLGVEVRVGRENWRASEFQGCVDWLYSNPPCAAFSMGGTRKHWSKDARPEYTLQCFALIDDVEPAVFSWECVARAAKAKDFQRERVAFCHERGYDVHAVLLDVADCGLPSRRRRFFFVASRIELDFERPAHAPSTPRIAWSDCDPGPIVPVDPCTDAVLRTMPPGKGSLADHFMLTHSKQTRKEWYQSGHRSSKEGVVKGRPGFMNRRLAWDEPAFTVAGGQHLFHPDEPRGLTVREQQLLLGYPADYEFVGTPKQAYAQIGKAVTPPAARWLGRQVFRGLERGDVVRGRKPLTVLWDFLEKRGDGEPVEWDLRDE
jgi:DNA (cytosine-5)-methyltransferase 1